MKIVEKWLFARIDGTRVAFANEEAFEEWCREKAVDADAVWERRIPADSIEHGQELLNELGLTPGFAHACLPLDACCCVMQCEQEATEVSVIVDLAAVHAIAVCHEHADALIAAIARTRTMNRQAAEQQAVETVRESIEQAGKQHGFTNTQALEMMTTIATVLPTVSPTDIPLEVQQVLAHMLWIGDIVEYNGPQHQHLRQGQRAQVVEFDEENPDWVRVRTFFGEREGASGSVRLQYLRRIECQETRRIAALVDGERARLLAENAALGRAMAAAKKKALETTAAVLGWPPEMVMRVVETYEANYEDPRP